MVMQTISLEMYSLIRKLNTQKKYLLTNALNPIFNIFHPSLGWVIKHNNLITNKKIIKHEDIFHCSGQSLHHGCD